MKNFKILIVLFFCLSIHQAQAQFSVGIKGGYTIAWEEYGDVGLPDDAEIDVSGFNVSAQAYYQLGNHFKIGVEPGYIQRGAACVPGWNGGLDPVFRADTKLFLSYVEAPIMVSGNLSFFQNKFEVFGKVGYGATFMTSAFSEEMSTIIDEPVLRTKLQLDENSNLNRWDHGAYGGLGLGYNFGKHQVFIESDYYMGLKDADKFNVSKNRSIDISVGYSIRL